VNKGTWEETKKKKLFVVVIIASSKKQSLHVSILAPQHFSFLFKTYQRDSVPKPAYSPGPAPAQQPFFSHRCIFKREKSFIRLLTLEKFWSLQKNNSHSCYMTDWPRSLLDFRCPKSQWWFAFTAHSIPSPLLVLHSVVLLPGPLPLYCTAG